MNEYISKQKVKDLMGCCLASAKANYKAETSVFKKEQFKHYAETIEAMIDVVGAVEAADVQPVKRGRWVYYKNNGIWDIHKCTVCNTPFELPMDVVPSSVFCYCPHCGADMRGEQND